jgi:hypothetical protein
MLFFVVRERCAPLPQRTGERGPEAVCDPGEESHQSLSPAEAFVGEEQNNRRQRKANDPIRIRTNSAGLIIVSLQTLERESAVCCR